MNKEFQGKNEWAIILGGSSGLGLATAKKLAKHSLNICVIHRNSRAQMAAIEMQFQEIKKHQIRFLSYNIDALHPEKRTQILSEIQSEIGENGRIKTLVHSIAKGNLKPMFSDEKPILQNEDFQLTINAMAISLYDWFQAIFQQKMFADDARIISFTSEGNAKPWEDYGAVSAAKVTLEAITRNIALEFAKFGIRANCIQAGVTDTQSLQMISNSDEIKKHTLQRNPFQRLTTPEDVANAVYLLCTKEASWINGTILKVDGGESLR